MRHRERGQVLTPSSWNTTARALNYNSEALPSSLGGEMVTVLFRHQNYLVKLRYQNYVFRLMYQNYVVSIRYKKYLVRQRWVLAMAKLPYLWFLSINIIKKFVGLLSWLCNYITNRWEAIILNTDWASMRCQALWYYVASSWTSAIQ